VKTTIVENVGKDIDQTPTINIADHHWRYLGQ